VVRHNLPVQRTPLIGRKVEIEEVASLVDEHRLVTLLGIGGTGKTRLATAVAAEVAARFTDGVWFVDPVPASTGGGRLVVGNATDPSPPSSASSGVTPLHLVAENVVRVAEAVADGVGLGEFVASGMSLGERCQKVRKTSRLRPLAIVLVVHGSP
jgi:hypothetical protein